MELERGLNPWKGKVGREREKASRGATHLVMMVPTSVKAFAICKGFKLFKFELK
jgi:hypothetical protein